MASKPTSGLARRHGCGETGGWRRAASAVQLEGESLKPTAKQRATPLSV
ncbi:MAG TPA: hypothetical protein VHY08_14945 [Bacillota bacterium]|nr:hypothetical protein [Bacillota bacterium]